MFYYKVLQALILLNVLYITTIAFLQHVTRFTHNFLQLDQRLQWDQRLQLGQRFFYVEIHRPITIRPKIFLLKQWRWWRHNYAEDINCGLCYTTLDEQIITWTLLAQYSGENSLYSIILHKHYIKLLWVTAIPCPHDLDNIWLRC